LGDGISGFAEATWNWPSTSIVTTRNQASSAFTTSQRKISFFRKSGADTPELDQLLDLITTHLKSSAGTVEVQRF